MSDTSASVEGNWADAWIQMQRQYWDAWSELAKRSAERESPAPAEAASPWVSSLDFWSKVMKPAMPDDSRPWLERVLEMNKGYVQMGESLWKSLAAGAEARSSITQWWEAVSRSLKDMQQQAVAATSDGTQDPWKGFATFWGLPLDTWRRVSSACSLFPGDMEKALRDLGVPREGEPFPAILSGWLSTPTLGYTREWQEEFQRLGQRVLAYQQAMQDYSGVLCGVVGRAAELLRDKALERVQKGEPFDSLRECYNLWVDCGEEAYAEVCASEAFTRAQAAMTNALMAMKRQEQTMVDEWLSALNMPTRRELDTSHRRVHHLQRRVWRLEETLEAAGVAELRQELAALRDEIKALRTAGAEPAAPVSTSAPRRSTRAKSDS